MKVQLIYWADGTWSGDMELIPESDRDQDALERLAEEGEIESQDGLRASRKERTD